MAMQILVIVFIFLGKGREIVHCGKEMSFYKNGAVQVIQMKYNKFLCSTWWSVEYSSESNDMFTKIQWPYWFVWYFTPCGTFLSFMNVHSSRCRVDHKLFQGNIHSQNCNKFNYRTYFKVADLFSKVTVTATDIFLLLSELVFGVCWHVCSFFRRDSFQVERRVSKPLSVTVTQT